MVTHVFRSAPQIAGINAQSPARAGLVFRRTTEGEYRGRYRRRHASAALALAMWWRSQKCAFLPSVAGRCPPADHFSAENRSPSAILLSRYLTWVPAGVERYLTTDIPSGFGAVHRSKCGLDSSLSRTAQLGNKYLLAVTLRPPLPADQRAAEAVLFEPRCKGKLLRRPFRLLRPKSGQW